VIDDAYALELYMMAVAVVEAKGTIITVGLTTLREYRHGNLIVHYMPSTGHLDIWYRRKVFYDQLAQGCAASGILCTGRVGR